jgi:hypothetical protein
MRCQRHEELVRALLVAQQLDDRLEGLLVW